MLIAVVIVGLLPVQQESEVLETASLPPIQKKCTTIIVGKDASADGSVLLAHNEDLGGYPAQHYIVVPRIQYEPGATVTTWFGAVVPQVEETLAYIATTIFDKSYIPGDITSGINEYQVAVANNLAYQREATFPYPRKGRIIWTEFTQFALERATSAREAVQIIGDLAHTYKHWGSGTLLGITDPAEGWWIEITQDGQWVAQRVPDDVADMRANSYGIGVVDFEDPQNFMYSEDLVDYAIEKGWYDSSQGPFDFTKVYANPISVWARFNTRRQWRVPGLLDQYLPEVEPKDLMAILRDHYEGTRFDETWGYRLGSPHHTSEYTLCRIETEVSVVCQSRDWLPAEIGGVCWRAMATPCTSVFTPWYMGVLEVPQQYQTGTDEFTPGSAYWTFRRLSESVDTDYGDLIEHVRGSWREFERREFASQETIERLALQLYSEDVSIAKQFLTTHCNNLALRALWMASDW